MRTVSITIDGNQVTAHEGDKLLWVALDNSIYIPNLCAIKETEEPAASCRLCFVEIEGYNGPVTACTEPVREGMVVNTQGPKARRLARTALELILASHPVDCSHCAANGRCELQRIAAHLGVSQSPKESIHQKAHLGMKETCKIPWNNIGLDKSYDCRIGWYAALTIKQR